MKINQLLNSTPSSPTASPTLSSTLLDPLGPDQNDHGAGPARMAEVTMLPTTSSAKSAQTNQVHNIERAAKRNLDTYDVKRTFLA